MKQQRKYVDFKLYLTTSCGGQGACETALLPTPEVGEVLTPIVTADADAPDGQALERLAGKLISIRELAELGKKLANCLFPGEIRARFDELLNRTDEAGGIRLRLLIASNSLRQWPWEYAYLNPLGKDAMRNFLALDPRVSIVRHEALARPHPTISAPKGALTELRVVVAAASPKGQRELNVKQEISNIEQAVKDFNVEGVRVSCHPTLPDVTRKELEEALRGAGSVYVFHFAGHGITVASRDQFNAGNVERGRLLLLRDKTSREEEPLEADQLGVLLQQAGVRMAVLGACHSGERSARYPWDSIAGALVAHNVPVVLAMQYEVLDPHAIAFSDALYTALAGGVSLDEAVWWGRQAMLGVQNPGTPTNVEWGVPVLYSRLADGVLFPERAAAEGQVRAAVTQNIREITSGGEVTGIRAKRIGSKVEINQTVDVVNGLLEGMVAGTLSGYAKVDQRVGTVKDGKVIGIEIDDL
jgi:CHAT domain